MTEIRTLPEHIRTHVAAVIVAANRLSVTPTGLLIGLGYEDRLLVNVGDLWSIGFRAPTDGFRAICERNGLGGSGELIEKAWTMRIGGCSRAFFEASSAQLLSACERSKHGTLVARMRLSNARALRHNLRHGFEPVTVYKDSVNGQNYLLTALSCAKYLADTSRENDAPSVRSPACEDGLGDSAGVRSEAAGCTFFSEEEL